VTTTPTRAKARQIMTNKTIKGAINIGDILASPHKLQTLGNIIGMNLSEPPPATDNLLSPISQPVNDESANMDYTNDLDEELDEDLLDYFDEDLMDEFELVEPNDI
jgi:hypothetical protein